MFDAHARKNILIFDNLFHYKNIATVQWIKRLKLCMVTMATLPPAKELKIQVVSWQNEIRTLDVLKSPTCLCFVLASQATQKVHIRGFINEPTTYLYSAHAGLVHNA